VKIGDCSRSGLQSKECGLQWPCYGPVNLHHNGVDGRLSSNVEVDCALTRDVSKNRIIII